MNAAKTASEKVAKQQEAELNVAEMDPELREKIRGKFKELVLKNPKMKKHRAMRKAGEFYKVKFIFDEPR